MSVRGGVKHAERRANDFYETPAWCVRAILPLLPANPYVTLDAGCGTGAILRLAAGIHRQGIELDAKRAEEAGAIDGVEIAVGDYLAGAGSEPADLVLSNPPYSLALDFVRESIRRTAPRRGIAALLMPITFLGSRSRAAFLAAHPCDVHPLVGPPHEKARPSFTGDGGTYATEYAWFVWGPGRGGRWSIVGPEVSP